MSKQNPLDGMDAPLKRLRRQRAQEALPQEMRDADAAIQASPEVTGIRALIDRSEGRAPREDRHQPPQALHISEVPDDVLSQMAAAEIPADAGEELFRGTPLIDAPLSSHDPVDRWVMAHPGQPIAPLANKHKKGAIDPEALRNDRDENVRDTGGARR